MTPQDLKQIANLFDKRFDKIDKRFNEVDKNFIDIKADIAVLKHKAYKNEKAITKINDNILKWKSEVFDAAEKFMIETRDQREFRLIGQHQIISNTDRIKKLEKSVFGSISGA